MALMQTVLKNILLVVILLSFNACQLFEDSPELQQKKQELELKKLQAMQDKELAAIEMQKSLATIEKEKTLELQKLQNEITFIELSANSEKELELIKQKVLLQENANNLNFQLYLFVFLIFLVSVISFFVFYYAKKKREDELRAYNDNLKKYFYHKENETRMEISKMILSTVALGELSKENERKLIQAFAADQHDYDNDAEIIASIEAPKEKR
ncbi:MAG: hypothetical protein IBX43_02440 [Campylobacterales bacterium]|nr:hypothetical protein [Campylobacterales bacterium]